MLRSILAMTLLATVVLLSSCKDAAKTPSSGAGTDIEWPPKEEPEKAVSSAFAEVKMRAQAADHPILVVFTGSDWCQFSKLLKAQVLDSAEWVAFVKDTFEVYVADFPLTTKLAPEVARLNQQLQKAYSVTKYPLVLVLKPDGSLISPVDFRDGEPPKEFMARIKATAEPGSDTVEVKAVALKGAEIHAATGAGTEVDYLSKGVKPGQWSMDYAAVVKAAKESGKPILFKFTGSDWCSWCKLMNSKVLRQASWQRFARRHLILFVLDFPQDKVLPPEVVQRNMDFQRKFGVEGYPTFVLVEPDGESVVGVVEHDLSPHLFRQNAMDVMRLSSPHVERLCATLDEAEAKDYKQTVATLKTVHAKRRKLYREGQGLFRRGALTEAFETKFMAIQKELLELSDRAQKVIRRVFANKLEPSDKARYLRLCEQLDQAEKNLTDFVTRSKGGAIDVEGLNMHQQVLFMTRDKKAELEFKYYHSRFHGEAARTFKRLFSELQTKRTGRRNWLLTNPDDSPESIALDSKFRDEIAELEDRLDAMKELQLKENQL